MGGRWQGDGRTCVNATGERQECDGGGALWQPGWRGFHQWPVTRAPVWPDCLQVEHGAGQGPHLVGGGGGQHAAGGAARADAVGGALAEVQGAGVAGQHSQEIFDGNIHAGVVLGSGRGGERGVGEGRGGARRRRLERSLLEAAAPAAAPTAAGPAAHNLDALVDVRAVRPVEQLVGERVLCRQGRARGRGRGRRRAVGWALPRRGGRSLTCKTARRLQHAPHMPTHMPHLLAQPLRLGTALLPPAPPAAQHPPACPATSSYINVMMRLAGTPPCRRI